MYRNVLAALLLGVVLNLQAFTLVKDGKPVATIVISAEAMTAKPMVPMRGAAAPAASVAKLAAQDLQTYVAKISGATLPIVGDDKVPDGPHILVGKSALTQSLDARIPSGLTPERNEEGYVIIAKGDTLLLAGNDEGPYLCTYYAVAALLKKLGVRWIMPGDFGEVVPKAKTLEVADMNVVDKPSFRLRTWWCNIPADMNKVESLWKIRNNMQVNDNDIVGVPGDSRLRAYMPDKKLVETKPELFAMRPDGTINPYMPNLSNPDAADAVAQKVIAKLKDAQAQGKPLDFLGFAPDDGLPMDARPETLKKLHQGFTDWVGREGVVGESSISEEWFHFMNMVVAEVAKEYPKVIITTNGYANRAMPPEGMSLNPNMGVMVAQIWADTLKPVTSDKSWHAKIQSAELQQWCKLNPRVFLYEYNATMLVTALAPVPQVHKLFENSSKFADWGIIGYFDETTLPYMQDGIATRYFRANLMWNAKPDEKAALNDYYSHWYGPAAKPAAAFWNALEQCLLNTPLLGHEDRILPYVYTPELVSELEMQCSAEEAAAKAEPYKTRVRVDRLTLEHLKAYMAMSAAEEDGRWTDAAKAADSMIQLRLQLNSISPFLILPPSLEGMKRYYGGEGYWGVLARQAYYKKMAARTDGTAGELLAKAPYKAYFTTDPASVGRTLRWFETKDYTKWKQVDTRRPYYLQVPGLYSKDGMPYTGHMWYVLDVNVPAIPNGKKVTLYAPSVSCEAWVWVNGAYAGHRKYEEAYIRPNDLELDVTGLVKGEQKNQIAIWVSTGQNMTQAPEGMAGPVMLIAEKPDKQ